jgi:hypothetical protein
MKKGIGGSPKVATENWKFLGNEGTMEGGEVNRREERERGRKGRREIGISGDWDIGKWEIREEEIRRLWYREVRKTGDRDEEIRRSRDRK